MSNLNKDSSELSNSKLSPNVQSSVPSGQPQNSNELGPSEAINNVSPAHTGAARIDNESTSSEGRENDIKKVQPPSYGEGVLDSDPKKHVIIEEPKAKLSLGSSPANNENAHSNSNSSHQRNGDDLNDAVAVAYATSNEPNTSARSAKAHQFNPCYTVFSASLALFACCLI